MLLLFLNRLKHSNHRILSYITLKKMTAYTYITAMNITKTHHIVKFVALNIILSENFA